MLGVASEPFPKAGPLALAVMGGTARGGYRAVTIQNQFSGD